MSEAVDAGTGEVVQYEQYLAQLAQAKNAVEQAHSFDLVLEVRDVAKAAESYAKSKNLSVPMVNHATEILARAERRLGELLRDHGFGDHGGDRRSRGRMTLEELGVEPMDSKRAQLLASLPADLFEEAIRSITDKDQELTRAALRAKAKHYVREQQKHERAAETAALLSTAPVVDLADAVSWLAGQDECDLLLTDPPYSTDVDDVEEFAYAWLPEALEKVKPAGRAYVCIGAYPDELAVYLSVSPPEHLQLAQVLVWTYRNTLGPKPIQDYKLNWQAVLYYCGRNAPPLDCPEMIEQFAVQDINAPDGRRGDRWHAWQKPDLLAERLVRHSTEPGDLVLDPFVGTGTFVLAAGRLGRQARGCDTDKANLDIAVERGCHRA